MSGTATVSSKGWVVIPAEYRRKYKLRPGNQVRIVDYGGALSIVPASGDPVKGARGLLKGPRPLVRALRRAKKQERRREG